MPFTTCKPFVPPKLFFAVHAPFYPEAGGGSEHSTLALFRRLCQRGWQIEILCETSPSFKHTTLRRAARWQAERLLENPPIYAASDETLGFTCWRVIASREGFARLFKEGLRRFQPQIVLGHFPPVIPLLEEAAVQGYPSFYFVRLGADVTTRSPFPPSIRIFANSPFSASQVRDLTPHPVEVILPIIERNRYRTARRERHTITFINPISVKGAFVACEIARLMPQARFLFIKGGWSDYHDQEEYLAAVRSLPNVEIWDYQEDMSRVYAATNILIVPSQYKEPFCRLIVEAHVNGIPVVASKTGGIPYALGEGGILIDDYKNPDVFVEALQKLMSDENLYNRLSAQALENSRRPEFDPDTQVEKFLDIVSSCAGIA